MGSISSTRMRPKKDRILGVLAQPRPHVLGVDLVEGVEGGVDGLARLLHELGLKPVVTGDGIAVAVGPRREVSQKAEAALRAWKRMRDRVDAGEVSEDEYEAWKARFRD